jgi:hypothetical protein
MPDSTSGQIIQILIIVGMSGFFAYVLRVSLRKMYPEYKRPPWQATAVILILVGGLILFRVALEYRPSPDSDQTLINLAFFFILTSLFALVSR